MKIKKHSQLNPKNKLSEIDLFGYAPQFYLNGNTSEGTPPGGLCSIILILIYTMYFCTLINSMITYDNLQTFDSTYPMDD